MRSGLTESTAVSGDEQRRLVEQALRPRVMRALLQEALGIPSAHTECRILDVKYEPGEYCTVLYQLDQRLVIGTIAWGGDDEDMPQTDRLIAPLGMRVYASEHDPALPGLDVVRDPRALAGALRQALPECRDGTARVLSCRSTVLRYRPGRRCTFRVDAWLRDARGGAARKRVLFGKLYHEIEKATPAYREMQLLAESAPVRDRRVILARPAAFLPDLLMVLQEPVSGTPLDLLIGRMEGAATAGDPRGQAGVVRAAAALAAVHTAGLTAGRERPIASDVKRFSKRTARIAEVDPQLGRRMGELVAALRVGLDQLPAWGAERTLIHGDCKPNQFLIGAEGVAILDFDHCGMSDPANDVGTFLATLRQLGIHQSLQARGSAAAQLRSRWLVDLERRFLEEYHMTSGFGADFRLRAVWYEAAALMRKGVRAFGRSPRSPMAPAQVEEAGRVLATLPSP